MHLGVRNDRCEEAKDAQDIVDPSRSPLLSLGPYPHLPHELSELQAAPAGGAARIWRARYTTAIGTFDGAVILTLAVRTDVERLQYADAVAHVV